MTMPIPAEPKIYHIVHVDRLSSIITDGRLWCDAEIVRRSPSGTTIGMDGIKQRRLNELTLTSYPDLHVGDCVPFYFCPRSIMLYLIYRANHPELGYRGGQGPIVHLEGDLRQSVAWAVAQGLRWAFTLSNAGTRYFEDRCDLVRLGEMDEFDIMPNHVHGILSIIETITTTNVGAKNFSPLQAAMQGRQAGGIFDRAPISMGIGLAHRRAVTSGLRSSHHSLAICCA